MCCFQIIVVWLSGNFLGIVKKRRSGFKFWLLPCSRALTTMDLQYILPFWAFPRVFRWKHRIPDPHYLESSNESVFTNLNRQIQRIASILPACRSMSFSIAWRLSKNSTCYSLKKFPLCTDQPIENLWRKILLHLTAANIDHKDYGSLEYKAVSSLVPIYFHPYDRLKSLSDHQSPSGHQFPSD